MGARLLLLQQRHQTWRTDRIKCLGSHSGNQVYKWRRDPTWFVRSSVVWWLWGKQGFYGLSTQRTDGQLPLTTAFTPQRTSLLPPAVGPQHHKCLHLERDSEGKRHRVAFHLLWIRIGRLWPYNQRRPPPQWTGVMCLSGWGQKLRSLSVEKTFPPASSPWKATLGEVRLESERVILLKLQMNWQ